MKHGKKPTMQQKKLLEAKRMNPADWLVCKDTPEEMWVEHRHFPSVRKRIRKPEKEDSYGG